MIQVSKLLPQGQGLAPVLLRRAATLTLDWDDRQKSRLAATDSTGTELGIFLPPGQVLRGGDVLVAEDGRLVRVVAAEQPLLRVTPCAQHGSPFDLVRAAYHLGNRHVALELRPEHLQFEPDPVLAEMLRRMHLIVTPVQAAFEPESGAYVAAATPGHHGHDHHDHGPDCGHDPDHSQHHAGHVHSAECQHGHPHDPGHGHTHADEPGHALPHPHSHSH